MLERIISVLKAQLDELEKSALKNTPDRNLLFHYGKKCGGAIELQKALNAIQQISDEAEAAHEIRR